MSGLVKYILWGDGTLQLKLQGKIGQTTLKVSVLNKNAAHSNSLKSVEDKIKNQITKYQMCMGCLGCEVPAALVQSRLLQIVQVWFRIK